LRNADKWSPFAVTVRLADDWPARLQA
jgi:hypothetical protein